MSIFGSIMSAIFGKAQAAPSAGSSAASSSAAPTASPSAASASGQNVDVEKVLTEAASNKKEKLDWRKFDRRPDEAARPRQQPRRAQGAGQGARLHRRHERLGRNEHLAAQAGDDRGSRPMAARFPPTSRTSRH